MPSLFIKSATKTCTKDLHSKDFPLTTENFKQEIHL